MTNWEAQQKEFQIQKGIREAEDDLVIAIEDILNNKESCKDLEESQYRNLMHVADTTDSAEVIKNFLRYQMGRGDKWGLLAQKIINDIDEFLQKKATKIVSEVKYPEELKPKKVKSVRLELTRRYLGYGSRRLKFLNAKNSN